MDRGAEPSIHLLTNPCIQINLRLSIYSAICSLIIIHVFRSCMRLLPRLCTDTFLSHLKTYILSALELGALLSSYFEGALYKFLHEFE